MKFLPLTALVFFLGCKPDPLKLKNGESLVIKSTTMSCFHTETKKTVINKYNNRYYITTCKIHPLPESGVNYYGIRSDIEEGVDFDSWNAEEYRVYMQTIQAEMVKSKKRRRSGVNITSFRIEKR